MTGIASTALRGWLSRAAICVAAFAGDAGARATRAETATPLPIAGHRQVFIDRTFLATASGVRLCVHPPRKTGEHTIESDQPWEKGIGSYNSVLKVDDAYHMWYRSGEAMCYARSADGIHWDKPPLGLVEYAGRRDNNFVVGRGAGGAGDCGHGGMVFLDPTAPADQRLRMALRENEPAQVVSVYSSPDGLHWKLTHPGVIGFTTPDRRHHLDSQNVIFWDDAIGKYVAYMRRNLPGRGSQGRTIARSESPVLGGFTEAQRASIVIGHDDLDTTLGDYAALDYYTSAAIKCPWAQAAYYMFPAAYFHYVAGELSEFPDTAPTNAGPLHTQFAASRDGITWQRFDRRPFVRLGLKGDFDSMAARVFFGLVPSLDGREMYLYYVGGDRLHGWGRDDRNNQLLTDAGLAPPHGVTIISRLVARRDGFISVRSDYAGGEFTTPPLVFEGRRLVLNIDTSAAGIARVGLLDAAGEPIQGCSLDDCDRIHTCNEINRVVTWRRASDVSRLAGQPVRLHFVMRDCDLYAFQFQR